MGHDTHLLIALIALLTRCVLADYYIQITETTKRTNVFNERVFPQISTPNTAFGTVKGLNLEGAIKIEDWSYSLDTPVSFIGGSTGGASSKTHFSPLSINRVADGYSPLLFQYNTKPVATLTLTLAVTSGVGRGTVQLSALYKFSGVYVTAFSQSAGDAGPVRETLQIDYAQLSMQYGAFGPDGRIAKVNAWGWDIRTQRPL